LEGSKHPIFVKNKKHSPSISTDAMFALVTEDVPWCNTFWKDW